MKSLLGKEFESVSVKGSQLIKGRTLRLRFFMHADRADRPKKPTMGISGGCNALGSGFRVRKGRLSSRGRFLGTLMGCKVSPDRWLVRKFRKGLKARTNGKRLVLSRPAEGVRFVFKRIVQKAPVAEEPPVVDEPLVVTGDPATAEGLLGKSFESVRVVGQVLKKPIELAFVFGKVPRSDDEGNQAEGLVLAARLGCNWMSGEYEVEDGQLRWLDVMTTDMWCQYDKDRWFYNLLKQGVTATTDGPRLFLVSGKTQIVFREAR